jgi:N-acylglucosamine-6-phosphate 2-epimerase
MRCLGASHSVAYQEVSLEISQGLNPRINMDSITKDLVERLRGVLVVSCQAAEGEPLCHPSHILALALSAITGGAGGLRLEGSQNIEVVRPFTRLPIIGLAKNDEIPESERLNNVYITATFEEAEELAGAGADIIAVDATPRRRPNNLTLATLIERIHTDLNKPVLADISTFEEGVEASKMGADFISTTLFGYTAETRQPQDSGPGLELLEQLIGSIQKPVVLEGRIWNPSEVTRAFELGAHFTIVGSAITRPQLITERFVKAIPLPQKIRMESN